MPHRPAPACVAAVLAAVVLGAPAASAGAEGDWKHDFGAVSLALGGGFQIWTLPALEESFRARAAELATDSYALGNEAFDFTYAYGAELQFRVSGPWFARAQFEWTRMKVEDRDRQFLQYLGGADRTSVSLSYATRVQTRPLLGSFGLGRAWRSSSVRAGLAASLVVAPLRVVDNINVFLETETDTEVHSDGTGLGGELSASLDYFTDVDMTLFVEVFGRLGSVDVELTDDVWDGTIIPQRRRVDLDGGGIRLGFRWI